MSNFEWTPTAEKMPFMNGEGNEKYSNDYLITVFRKGIDEKPFVDYGRFLIGYDNCDNAWLCNGGTYDAKDVFAWKSCGIVYKYNDTSYDRLTMTREQAIEIIRQEYLCVNRDCNIEKNCDKCDLVMPSKEPILEAYKMSIKALEQEPCEDLINRKELDKALYERFHEEDSPNNITDVPLGEVRNFIKNFPSAVNLQEPKSIQEKQAESEKYQKAFDDGYDNGYAQARFDYEQRAKDRTMDKNRY